MTMIPQKQLSLADIFEDCKDFYESDKPHFLTLLENHIDLDEIFLGDAAFDTIEI